MRIPYASIALMVALSSCGSYQKNQAAYQENNAAYAEGAKAGNYSQGANYSAGNAATTASSEWPKGARIVVENGVTYRVEPGGVRVALGPNDSRIVIENGVRYRVDPSGTRVRIDPSGAVIEVNTMG